MAHFPKPFFKQARQLWYVEIDRKQVCLGLDQDEAFQKYHALMQARRKGELSEGVAGSNPLVAVLADAFLDWVKRERAPDTFEWHRYVCASGKLAAIRNSPRRLGGTEKTGRAQTTSSSVPREKTEKGSREQRGLIHAIRDKPLESCGSSTRLSGKCEESLDISVPPW